jgi:hypothetical protein
MRRHKRHGVYHSPKLPAALVPGIDSAMQNYRQQLSAGLEHLRNELMPESERIGWAPSAALPNFLFRSGGCVHKETS